MDFTFHLDLHDLAPLVSWAHDQGAIFVCDAAQAAPPELKILRKPFDTDTLRGIIQDTMEVNLTH